MTRRVVRLLFRCNASRQLHSQTHQESAMDRNRIEGTAKELKGSVKEAIGKVTHNRAKQAEGAAEKIAGRMQTKVGEAADAVRERLKR
jgi:uncharacterized protein YjbJ (UPF0337 family)